MHFCFIVEAQYRNDSMPMTVLHQLRDWGHNVDVLEPQRTITSLSELFSQHYDAYVLKTASDGPGLSILETAEAAGIPTINRPRAIRQVRDKAVAMAIAMAHGLPTPYTYFASDPRLLSQIPDERFPLVLKPNNGSSCRDIHFVKNAAELPPLLDSVLHAAHFWLAQHYEENPGFDIKVYVAGEQVFAVAKRSPLHPEISVEKRLLPVSSDLRQLAMATGQLFGLDLFGLDIVETAHGPMIVDINDFPSFGYVPDAQALVAGSILETVEQRLQRFPMERSLSLTLPQEAIVPMMEPASLHFHTALSTH